MEPFSNPISFLQARPHLRTLLSVSAAIFACGVLSLTLAIVPPHIELALAATETAQSNKAVAERTRSSDEHAPILEIHIANNGMVYLQGARIESVSGTSIVVSTSWNAIKMLWTIRTDETYYGPRHFGTNFLDQKGNRLAVGDLRVGDVLKVNGIFEAGQREFVVQADMVRVVR